MAKNLIPIEFSGNAKRTRRFWRLVSVLIVAAMVAMGVPTTAPMAFAASAEVKKAEGMIWGTEGHSSPATGRLILERAIEKGDVEAQRALGLHLVYGWVLNKDVDKGFELLTLAANAGDADAQNALGQLYFWGTAGRINKSLSRQFLEAASAQGHLEAKRTLGQQLVNGAQFEQDVPTGLKLLKEAASKGDAKAYVTLGDLYLEGRDVPYDRKIARNYFEKAAELGNGQGLLSYGEDTMWREINSRAAEEALLKAAAVGETRAYVVLANGAMYGYLGGGKTSRSKYAGYAEKATEAGEEYVAVLEAERLLWGIGVRASGPRAIEVLTAAADQGNAEAARYLIALLRDGNNLNVRRAPSEARKALTKYSGLLSEQQIDQYDLTLKAERARTPAAYAPVAEEISQRSDLASLWFGKEIYKANPNVALYTLQNRLRAQGIYGGALNGYATPNTLRAIYMACLVTLDRAICDDNVLRDDVIGALLAQPETHS